MSDKKKSWTGSLAGETTDTQNHTPVPLGKRWVVTEFGGADINNGDNKSSVYLLKWGGVAVEGAYLSLSGTTKTLKSTWEFTGDGVKFLSVERRNTSKTAKEMPVWVLGYET